MSVEALCLAETAQHGSRYSAIKSKVLVEYQAPKCIFLMKMGGVHTTQGKVECSTVLTVQVNTFKSKYDCTATVLAVT